jgi:hypothetical protein
LGQKPVLPSVLLPQRGQSRPPDPSGLFAVAAGAAAAGATLGAFAGSGTPHILQKLIAGPFITPQEAQGRAPGVEVAAGAIGGRC